MIASLRVHLSPCLTSKALILNYYLHENLVILDFRCSFPNVEKREAGVFSFKRGLEQIDLMELCPPARVWKLVSPLSWRKGQLSIRDGNASSSEWLIKNECPTTLSWRLVTLVWATSAKSNGDLCFDDHPMDEALINFLRRSRLHLDLSLVNLFDLFTLQFCRWEGRILFVLQPVTAHGFFQAIF